VGETAPIGPLVRLARAASDVGAPCAGALARQALARAELPPELRDELAQIAPTNEVEGPEPEAASVPEPEESMEVVQVEHGLQTMEAIPRSLDDGTLELVVDGTVRHLSLRKVQAIAVAGVNREGKRPLVVVDLMLDPPWSDRETLRVVRLVSTAFDPRTVVGGPDAQEAFRAMLGRMLDDSGASPLPDPDAARGRPFRTYGSLAEYQAKVLGVRHETSA